MLRQNIVQGLNDLYYMNFVMDVLIFKGKPDVIIEHS